MEYNYGYKISNKSYKFNNLRGFKIKYLGATNYLGSRVKITDTRHNKSITLSYDYSIGDIAKQAIKYLSDRDIKIEGMSNDERTNEYNLLSLNFGTQIK